MLIEIRKGGFVNKGAELMLLGALDQLRANFPAAEFVMAAQPISAPYKKRAQLGFYQKLNFWRCHVQWGLVIGLVPGKIRSLFGIVSEREIDAVIDIAGFAYGDACALRNTLELADSCRRWKRQGTKVILMPQAFGPFTGAKIRHAIQSALRDADLIFARDSASFQHLHDLHPCSDKIFLAPDFTQLVEGQGCDPLMGEERQVCIVPNSRMIDKTSSADGAAYLALLVKLARQLRQDNRVFFLIHEGEGDRQIADQVNRELGDSLPTIAEPDPLRTKGIIGRCDLVISSRFHALVSALSQGVPALGTGWSHKYQMLFEDYGFPEGLLDVRDDDQKIDVILQTVFYKNPMRLKEKLLSTAKGEKAKTQDMWARVFETIAQK